MVDGKIGIELVDFLLHRRGDGRGIGRVTQHDVQRSRRRLRVRHVEGDPSVRVEAVLLHPSDDAHDGVPRTFGLEIAKADAPADRILVRPQLARHELVDDDDARFFRCVAVVEEAAPHERDAHGLEVPAGRDALVRVDEVFAGRRHAPFDGNRAPREVAAERQ